MAELQLDEPLIEVMDSPSPMDSEALTTENNEQNPVEQPARTVESNRWQSSVTTRRNLKRAAEGASKEGSTSKQQRISDSHTADRVDQDNYWVSSDSYQVSVVMRD